MMTNLKDFTITSDETEADIIIINSCTVTNSADSSARSYINKASKYPKNPKLFFTGCGVSTKGKELFEENKVQSIFGHSEKESINSLLKKDIRFTQIGDLKHIDKTIVENFVGKSRAFIKIQEGCNFACSYSIIPSVRGKSRSIDEAQIITQISKLANNGFGEFIFTGINVGSYGQDTGTSIAKLLKKVSQIRGVRRIRLGSIEPIQIDDEFKEILSEHWMSKHLHIAIQHTSKEMLKIMNRRNSFAKDLELFEYLSKLGYAIGTDYIVGHPKESDEIWQEAMQNLDLLPLTHIHAFTYSPRDGTKSAQYTHKDIVKGDIAKQRYNELIKKIEYNNYNFRKDKLLSKTALEVLVESYKDGYYQGYDQFFNPIKIQSDMDLKGSWVEIKEYEVKSSFNEARFLTN
jgi:MiaB-like tRNA modifying enzyme